MSTTTSTTLEVRGYLYAGQEVGYTYPLNAADLHTLLHGTQLERERTLRVVAGDFAEVLDYAIMQRRTTVTCKILSPFRLASTLDFLSSLESSAE